MHLKKIVMTGKSLVVVSVFTGRVLMKISELMDCFVVHQLPECVCSAAIPAMHLYPSAQKTIPMGFPFLKRSAVC